ncbi:MAG TPA: hypothetical protein VI864_05855 [Candidatus Bathyarchaeia archaeon]|nr:hypothetical protein [Candidatus Bathyarchaeia archaeon]
MPNLTISVSDELKAEMDKLSEVNWSEVCRNAISMYIEQRKDPTPKIELDIRNSRLYDYDYETGYPTLIMDIRIQNRMNSEITVDRILTIVRALDPAGRTVPFGQANDLHRRIIGSNSVGLATIRLAFPREKLGELQNIFKSTFDCRVNCVVFVDGFKNEYRQEITFQIPIDVWNNVLEKALGKNQATQ